MTIIDNTVPYSPLYTWRPHPEHFRSTYEKDAYWAEEKCRWIEGYGELTGDTYFYWQEQWLKHRVVPKGHDAIERPTPKIATHWMRQRFKKTRDDNKVQGVIKARGVGLSTEGGALANWFAKTTPGSTCLITSKDQAGITMMFREKIYIPYQYFDDRIRPDEVSKNDTKQSCDLRLGVKHIGVDGTEKYSLSSIVLRETSEKPKSPTNFSGQGAQFGYYDELPLHPRRDELIKSSIECYRDPETKEIEGFLLWGGTCEETMTDENISALRKMVDNKDIWNTDILFIPFWWSMFLTNGHPDEKKSEEWWDREANKIANDPSLLKAFIRNNPRTLDDIFDSAKGGRWEEDVEQILIQQRSNIIKADISLPKYNIITLGGKTEAAPSNKGSIYILEHPKPSCTYILCVDGVATDTDTGDKEGSKMAGVIVKMFDPVGDPYMPVCLHSERPKTIESGYQKLIGQARYYNQHGGFQKIYAEANVSTASHFGNTLLNEGLQEWIAMRRDLSGKGWVDQKKMFQYRTDELIDFQYKSANIFLRRFAHSIQMLPLIDSMLLPVGQNADELDAWLQFFTAKPDFLKTVKPKILPKPKPKPILVNEGGYNVWKLM